MTTVSPAHVTTAIRAVLDHIDEHGLVVPVEIHTPDHYLGGPDAMPYVAQSIGLDLGRVTIDQVAAWEESLGEGYDYDSEPKTSTVSPDFDYIRHRLYGKLPTGVRVTILARTPDDAHRARALTLVDGEG